MTYSSGAINEARVPVSFTVPLTKALGEEHVFFLKKAGVQKTECEAEPEPERSACLASLKKVEEACPGTVAEPKAASGNLCVYTGWLNAARVEGSETILNPDAPFEPGAGTAGAELRIPLEEPPAGQSPGRAYGNGTWAVTAP